MRVALVVETLSLGGAEKIVTDMALEIASRNIEVRVYYFRGLENFHLPDSDYLKVICLNSPDRLNLIHSLHALLQEIKLFTPDVIHSHMIYSNFICRFLRIFYKKAKIISSIHSSNEGGPIRMLGYKISDFLCDLTTIVSKDAKKNFSNLNIAPKNKFSVVENAINLKKFTFLPEAKSKIFNELKIDSDTKLILSVGALRESKDYPNLINALSMVKEIVATKFILMIAGDGSEKEKLQNQIEELNLRNHIVLLGIRNDVQELLSACDLFVLSSAYEGMPLVIIEAAAASAFIVSTNTSGVSDILKEHEDFIVPTQDSSALADAIIRGLELDHDTRKEIIKRHLIHVQEHYSFNTYIDKWISIYDSILNKNKIIKEN